MNWRQLQAILWLRWRLSRNQFVRGGQLNRVLSVLIVAFLALLAAGLGLGGIVLGVALGKDTPAPVLLLAWDAVIGAFLIFWFSGLLVEIQRAESIDLARLLHLPVTLPQVFLFNYAASHVTPSLVLFLPGMVGFCVGLMFTGGLAWALELPLVLSVVFALTAWTYCLRGWLAAIMINKRRRRTVILWVTVLFVGVAQLPNLIFNSPLFRRHSRPAAEQAASEARGRSRAQALPARVVPAHLALPPGWPGYGALALREGSAWPALAGTAAGLLLGLLGLYRAYRMTVRFYQGADSQPAAKPAPAPVTGHRRRLLVERRLPLLPDDTAALALATLRSLARAPELKMALIMPVVLGAVMTSAYFTRPKHPASPALNGLLASVVVVVAGFSLMPTMSNLFGLDRNGFRALVLLPTRRHQILLAKNLAFFPFVGGVTLAMLVVVKLLLRMPWGAFLTGLVQLPTAFLLLSLACNTLSILVPFRLAPGTLQAKKPKAIVFVAIFLSLLVLPLVFLPVMVPPALLFVFSYLGWAPGLPVNLLAAVLLFPAVVWLYAWLLPALGRLLQRREQAILQAVTEEVE